MSKSNFYIRYSDSSKNLYVKTKFCLQFQKFIAHPAEQQGGQKFNKLERDRNLVREKSGGSTYSTTDSTAAFVKEDYQLR